MLLLAASAKGLVACGFGSEDRFAEQLGIRGYELVRRHATDDRAGRTALSAMEQIDQYFDGDRRRFDLPLDLGVQTPFTVAVLREVAHRVPFGETATYGEIGERAGSPRSGRAVGAVMARCPFSIIVPCHRVVRVNRPSSEQGPGLGRTLNRKEWLISFERDMVASRARA